MRPATLNWLVALGTRSQKCSSIFLRMKQGQSAAAGATAHGGSVGAPGGSPASGDADSTLTLNGNNPVTWQMGTAWQDNLGALFTHDGIAETIYSTSTVDVAQSGTTTIDYWAQAPGAQWLHTTRDIVIASPAN